MYRRAFMACKLAGILMAASAIESGALAQGVLFCIGDGKQVKADRFEQRDGKFFLFVAGSASPLEYPAVAVVGINVPCPNSPVRQASAASLSVPTSATSGGDRFGLHGSNTIGERLMPMLIEAFAQKRLGARPTVKIGAPEEQEITVGANAIDLHAHGSGTSAKSLAAGTAQIGMSSRRATDPEVATVQSAHNIDLRSSGNEHVLALDGLAVIVNPANPVRQLTLDQIARIFSGGITNWSEVGGNSAPIIVHRRDDKSGTFDTFNALVLAPAKLKVAAGATAHESSETLSEEVFRNPNAIGFIGLPYINRTRALQIAQACGLADAPSKFTIKAESYPLARRLYLYSLGQPRQALARDLLAYTLSDDAQPTIQEAGFVDQSVELQAAEDQQRWRQGFAQEALAFLPAGKELPAAARTSLATALDTSRRTSLVLRFERASANLDTRAQQDVARFARFLKSPDARGKRFLIAGFADSDGGWRVNERLAADRTASVRTALDQAGVPVQDNQMLSFSYQAPVACNDTDTGRAKNRRVEIWLAK